MKKLLALILFVVYTISSTELREIVKLPVLVQHFNEHRQLNKDITFSQFLIDHYNNIPHTDNDDERDNQLPFKQADTNLMFSPVIPAPSPLALKKPVMPLAADALFPRYADFIPTEGVSKIWQPPRPGTSLFV